MSLAHSSPGMMLQFAIAGLLTAATVIVNERKTRSLQRLLTTATSRVPDPARALPGHLRADLHPVPDPDRSSASFLKVDYLRLPLATLLVAVATAVCIAALGLSDRRDWQSPKNRRSSSR